MAGRPKAMVPTLDDFAAMWKASGLKSKLLMTVLLLFVFRLGVQIPIWGADPAVISRIASGNSQLFGFVDMFSGGALTAVSVLALGIGPYITTSIIMQLLTVVIPRLEELQKEEGEQGRRKIAQYTRYGTVILALIQGSLVLKFIVGMQAQGALLPGVDPTLFFILGLLSLTAGSLFSLWIAEMLTDRGIGNGASLLILAGILSRLPFYFKITGEFVGSDPQRSLSLVMLLVIYLAIIGAIIVLQTAERRIFVTSAKRQVGNKIYGGQSTHLPFKLNPASVMPIIFAFAVLSFPSQLIMFLKQMNPGGLMLQDTLGLGIEFDPIRLYENYFSFGSFGYIAVEFLLIVFFTFFYASIIPSMQPREIAENLKKHGVSVPGIKPGKPTAEKLEEILSRTTLIGAVALALIALIGSFSTTWTGITTLQGLGSTSLIIMVGVALDTANQIRVHLLSRQYEGFLK
jgi:preprotein translocase subunit SecY